MAKITFDLSGKSVELDSGRSLVDLEEIKNNEVPFGCRSAACGTCAINVISGMNHLSPKNEDEIDLLDTLDMDGENRRLACQCIIYGDITIEPVN